MSAAFKYWAFISYSSKDRAWGEWLLHRMETYRVPKSLVGQPTQRGEPVPARVFPLFRDRDELPTDADLSEAINRALEQSRYLIVICSPHSATSRWVNKEIVEFKRLGRENRVLAIIIDGTPNATDGRGDPSQECFPSALRFKLAPDGTVSNERTEPIAADARPLADGKPGALLKLLAGVLGVNYDDLRRRDEERRRKQQRVVVSVSFALALVFATLAGAALWQWRAAEVQRNEAVAQKREAEIQRSRAEAKRLEALQNLSQSDFLQAVRLIGENNRGDALPYLVRSLKENPENRAALTRLQSLLSYNSWTLPTQVFAHVASAQFSLDGQQVITASEEGSVLVWSALTGQPVTAPLPHGAVVKSAQLSPDGKRILTAAQDQALRVWDAATGQLTLGPLETSAEIVWAQFSPDGRRIGAAFGSTVCVWDSKTGLPTIDPIPHPDGVTRAQFSPDGNRIAIVAGNAVFVWDTQLGKESSTPLEHKSEVSSVAFSADGSQIATASWDYTARIWDAHSGAPLSDPLKHDGPVGSAQFSPDGKRLVTASWDHTACIWDAQTGAMLVNPLRHGDFVYSAEFSPDGTRVVTGSDDGTARVWNAQTGLPVTESLKHGAGVAAARFSPDGKRVITSGGGVARIWDEQQTLPPLAEMVPQPGIVSAQFSVDGKRIVTNSAEGFVVSWDAQTRQPASPTSADLALLKSFSPDGTRVVNLSHPDDSTIRLLDVASGKLLLSLEQGAKTESVAFSRDGKVIAANSGAEVRLWDAGSGQLQHTLKHDAKVTSFLLNPDGKRILTASGSVVREWEIGTGKTLLSLTHDRDVDVIRYNPSATRIVTVSEDFIPRVWDAQSGQLLASLTRGPTILQGIPFHVEFSPDGKRIALASGNTVELWDEPSGQLLFEPLKLDDRLQAVQFSPDGTQFATASGSSLRVWDVQSGQPLTEFMRWDRGDILSARYSPDGTQIVTASWTDKRAYIWAIGPAATRYPDWLLPLAEVFSGQVLDSHGVLGRSSMNRLGTLDRLRQKLSQERDDGQWVTWGKWLLADPDTRTISPFSKIPVPKYLEALKN